MERGSGARVEEGECLRVLLLARLRTDADILDETESAIDIQITDAVHEKGSFIFAQLRAYGRSADPKVLEEEGPFPLISASDVPLKGNATPRPLTIPGAIS